MTDVSTDDSVAKQVQPRRWGRIAAITAGVLVVALGITAAVVVPRMLQAQRVEEYTALVGELRLAVTEQAWAQTTLEAATVLTYVHHSEALSVAHAVAALGESGEPMLPAEQAALLGQTGSAAAEELGSLDEQAAPADGAHEVLTLAYVEAKAAEEQARGEAEEAGDDVPEPVLATSLAQLNVDQAIELLASPVEPEQVTAVADEDVTDELIEQMRASIAAVEQEIEATQQAIAAETERQEHVSETVVDMLPVLHETAAAIDDYLAAVEEQAAKAEDEVAAKTTSAAASVRDSATSDDVAQIQGRIASYVVAGEASLESHAAVVKAEEEAAEAKRKAEAEAARKRSSAGSGSGGSCLKYVSTWYGGSRLVTVPCR